jgi:hypothetical protein
MRGTEREMPKRLWKLGALMIDGMAWVSASPLQAKAFASDAFAFSGQAVVNPPVQV